MALRTFQSNPSLGGFGSESTNLLLLRDGRSGSVGIPQKVDGDAFAQILKELVDNAVDACNSSERNSSDTHVSTPPHRVRVEIQSFQKPSTRGVGSDDEQYNPESDDDASVADSDSILQVTVVDNGCGMDDIQACVDPFKTSKAHATREKRPRRTTRSETAVEVPAAASKEAETAGRYGIGLTLCLLHAQRLVPGSCASIRSATSEQTCWKTMRCIIDAEGDSVKCLESPPVTKSFPEESGTSVSLLVPGGASATIAWPRLAEYFARFKLSLGMECSLEVLAPTLSKVPLCISPLDRKGGPTSQEEQEVTQAGDPDNHEGEEDGWIDGLTDDFFESSAKNPSSQKRKSLPFRAEKDDQSESEAKNVDPDRVAIWKVGQLFLGRPFDLSNVAHSVVPIRLANSGGVSTRSDKSRPTLEVDMLVHGPDEDDDSFFVEDGSNELTPGFPDAGNNRDSASLVLVRMVNRTPLLDSSEAAACGLVQAVAAKKRMWNSFGLEVTRRHDPSNVARLLTYELRDSEQVAPYFQRGNHALFEGSDGSDDDSDNEEELDPVFDGRSSAGFKRHRRSRPRQLLPASVRLGNILVIVQINAQPSNLPLPTLSKGRLPVDNQAIDNALEVGLTECMRKLQKTSPLLFLTASELREAERDARYIPGISSALASMICKSTTPMESVIKTISSWQCKSHGEIPTNGPNVDIVGKSIEDRIRMVIANGKKRKGKRSMRKVVSPESDPQLGTDDSGIEDLLSLGSLDQRETPQQKLAQESVDDSDHRDFEDW